MRSNLYSNFLVSFLHLGSVVRHVFITWPYLLSCSTVRFVSYDGRHPSLDEVSLLLWHVLELGGHIWWVCPWFRDVIWRFSSSYFQMWLFSWLVISWPVCKRHPFLNHHAIVCLWRKSIPELSCHGRFTKSIHIVFGAAAFLSKSCLFLLFWAYINIVVITRDVFLVMCLVLMP